MGRKAKKKFFQISLELQNSLSIVGLFVLALASFLSFFGIAGSLGQVIDHYYNILFGSAKYALAALLLIWSAYLFFVGRKKKKYRRNTDLRFTHYFGAFLIVLNTAGLASFWVWLSFDKPELGELIKQIAEYNGGGYLGFLSMAVFASTIGNILTGIILVALLMVGLMFTFQMSLNELIHKTYIFEWLGRIFYWLFLAILNLFKGLGQALAALFSKKAVKKESSEEELFASLETVEEGKAEDIITDKVDLHEEEAVLPANLAHLAEEEDEDDEDENSLVEVPVYQEGQSSKQEETLSNAEKLDMEILEGDSLFPYQTEEILSYNHDLVLDLLDKQTSKPKSGDIKFKAQQIKKTLHNFGIDVEMKDVQVGPVVTQFAFKPAEGIKLSRITALHDDLALALAAHPIRIEAPIPGKPYVGLEVPNEQAAVVRIRELIDAPEFTERKNNMQIVLGKDVSGANWVADLPKMPHLLVAGQTGSGKSVCLNSIIISLLYQNKPTDLRLIMVDPKRVELPLYNGIPHLLTPVITDIAKILNALKWTVAEMDRRYDILSKFGKRNIEGYNETAKERMPYIVFIIDELADIMVQAGREVETYIVRLTQMSRAVGIHLVLATQRPSVNVITGLIKANVPARIAFSVASQTDSRTILDKAGAEKLIGKGDMLYIDPKNNKPRRIQGVFVSDQEVKRISNSLKLELDEPVNYHDDVVEASNDSNIASYTDGDDYGNRDVDNDPLYSQALDIVLQTQKASASYLQRRLRIGFTRAARLIDIMEEKGVVGQQQGSKPREILLDHMPSDIIKTE